MCFFQGAVVTALIGVVAVGRASAQATDSLVPRAGTWGAEVSAISSGGELLRFTSPRTAWVVGFDATTNRQNRPAGDVGGASSSLSYLSLQIGHRWYVPAAGDQYLRVTYGAGVVGKFQQVEVGDDQHERPLLGGGYGELGATWFFTRHLSLGAIGELTAWLGHDRRKAPTFVPASGTVVTETTTSTSWSISTNLVRLVAAVYF